MNDYAVDVQKLSVRFGDFYAVKDVSFSVKRGEIFGFLGANGAGKTTTIRVLCGLLRATAGDIHIYGQNFNTAGAALKMRVGYMSQKFTLYDDMTVAENLQLAADLHHLERAKAKARQDELMTFIGWERDLNMLVRDLPGGQKQQVSLVASMMHNPDIVFLDEPTAGVSPAARARFWDLIRQLAGQGKTVFVTTHYMDEAEQCERIALMRSGELVALDTPEHLKNSTFPRGLLELEPLRELSAADLDRLRNPELFSLFEPYGLRFHAEVRSPEVYAQARLWLDSVMKTSTIKPSLEDVFIRIVEGQNR
jgi:ABC-2 type transport system ATP-binding protein